MTKLIYKSAVSMLLKKLSWLGFDSMSFGYDLSYLCILGLAFLQLGCFCMDYYYYNSLYNDITWHTMFAVTNEI